MRILVADDHGLFREGLRLQLESLLETAQVTQAADFDAAIAAAQDSGPFDLILIDLSMPGVNWRQALPILNERCPKAPVVVVSASDARADILSALAGGAAGYIPKSSSGQDMQRALELILSGGVYVPPELLRRFESGETLGQPDETRLKITLTPRQSEVLKFMAKGLSNKRIANALDLSLGTVKLHVAAVLKAFGADNRTAAVLAAARNGLLSGL